MANSVQEVNGVSSVPPPPPPLPVSWRKPNVKTSHPLPSVEQSSGSNVEPRLRPRPATTPTTPRNSASISHFASGMCAILCDFGILTLILRHCFLEARIKINFTWVVLFVLGFFQFKSIHSC